MALSVPISAAAEPVDDDRKPLPSLPSPSAQQLSAPPPDQNARPRVTPSPGTAAAFDTIQRRIVDYATKNGYKYTFGTYIDSDTGKIVVDTDAPPSDVSSLINLPAAASTEERQAANQVQVRRGTTTDLYHRRDDEPPFFGGAGITDGGMLCSSGYPVKNSAGTRFMVTAGHCFPEGFFVFTESGRHIYGNVSGRRLESIDGSRRDMELVGPQDNFGAVFIGGVTSPVAMPIVAYGDTAVGFSNYCYSGRTTGEQCGKRATSTTATVCTPTGCKSPVIAFVNGQMPLGGDSGAPFYAQSLGAAFIRGHIISANPTTGYAESYPRVASTYGVSGAIQ